MKIPFFIFLYFQIHKCMQLRDGESMKIDIDAEGKKKVKFEIDGHAFTVDLLRDKVTHELPPIPEEILKNQVEEYDLQQQLDKNFQDELDKSNVDLDGLTEEEKQQEINNLKVKTLKDQGVSLEKAADFVKKREGFDKFSIDSFALGLQEYLEKMRTEFDKVTQAQEKGQVVELDMNVILSLYEELDFFLRDAQIKAKSDPQDPNRAIHVNIITHVTNIIQDLFKKIKENTDKGSHNYSIYYDYINTLENEIKKINQFQQQYIVWKFLNCQQRAKILLVQK